VNDWKKEDSREREKMRERGEQRPQMHNKTKDIV